MSSSLSAGKEVLSYCNKCKLALAHIIVTMKDEKTIHKCKCKTCGANHAYKDPSAATKKKRRTTTRAKKAPAMSVSDMWMQKMSQTKNKSKQYSIKEKFELGDIIDHPKFGPGIVEAILDNVKMEIMFRHEIKVLMHNMN